MKFENRHFPDCPDTMVCEACDDTFPHVHLTATGEAIFSAIVRMPDGTPRACIMLTDQEWATVESAKSDQPAQKLTLMPGELRLRQTAKDKRETLQREWLSTKTDTR